MFTSRLEGVLSLVGTTIGWRHRRSGRRGQRRCGEHFGDSRNKRLPFRVVTQVPGRALRMPTDLVPGHEPECGDLHQRLLDYTHQMIAQVAQSAVCNRFHNARQRLARWLLMTADRAGTNELPLTHEFISYMVGGPRSAVTEAASELRESGAIDYRRGLIIIRNPARLREQSCECYAMLAELPAADDDSVEHRRAARNACVAAGRRLAVKRIPVNITHEIQNRCRIDASAWVATVGVMARVVAAPAGADASSRGAVSTRRAGRSGAAIHEALLGMPPRRSRG